MKSSGRGFRDRDAAGWALAGRLLPYRAQRPLVLALPRGGVPVAYPVAVALHAPLQVLPVRKLGASDQPELGVGAIALGGPLVLDGERLAELAISPAALAAIESREQVELQRQQRLFCAGRSQASARDRAAIIVDDGLATGVSALAAIRAVHLQGPRVLILAVPVGAPETVARLCPEVDDLVCLESPPAFRAVGAWYLDFRPTTDETVLGLLARASTSGSSAMSDLNDPA